MAKLAVVFFAVLAIQAAFGRYTPGFAGYDREEHGDLVRQLVTVADDIYEIFQNTPLQRGFSWENREFGQQIEEVIAYLEELTTKHDEQTSGFIFTVLSELREVRSYFRQLKTTADKPTMRKLEIDLAVAIKKVVRSVERFDEIFSEVEFTGTFHSGIKTALMKFVFALRNLYENVSEHTTTTMTSFERNDVFSTKRPFYGAETPEYYMSGKDIHAIAKELEVTLERVHFEEPLMKRAFMHLVRRYFENLQEVLTPEFQQHFEMFFHTKDAAFSVPEVKTQVFSFVKKFITRVEQMPQIAHVAFAKATRKFESRLDTLTEVNTPVRQLAIRVQILADLLTSSYEALPYQSGEFKGLFKEHAQQLIELLRRFVSKVEKNGAPHELIANLKKIVSHFENTEGQHTFVVVIQEIATEVRKMLIAQPENAQHDVVVLATEYLNILETITNEFDKLFDSQDVELWSDLMMANTNQLSLYVQDDINSQDWTILIKALNKMLEVLERESHPEYKKLAHALKQLIREYETESFMINSFLQKIALELNQFIWTAEQNGRVPKNVLDILEFYLVAIEKIHSNERTVSAYLYAQTPVELALKAQTVAERLNKNLHVMVPGFKQVKVANRVHYFNQILEVVMFRLRKISAKSDVSVQRVYENLNQIQSHLENVLEQSNLNTKVNFAVYIQNALIELRKLAFEQHFEGHPEFIKMYGDFLFGLEYLVNHMQYDLQVVVEQYSIKTLHLQIESVAHTISNYLQRVQPKPELKRVVLIQFEALSQVAKQLAFAFRTIDGGNHVFAELATKYIKIHDELRQVTKMGLNKSIEELTAYLDMFVNTIVRDLAQLTSYKQDAPEFYEVYTAALTGLSNIMARLENVHYYEYYNIIVKTPHFSTYLRRLSSNVAAKLQNTFVESEEIKYDLALQTLKFAQRLERIAARLQVEAKVFPKGLYSIIAELHRVGGTQSVSVHELRSKLSKYVMVVYAEIGQIIDHESTVGVKEALIKYIVAVEKLYFNIHNILVRSHNHGSFQTIFTRIDTYVHYLSEAIEHVDSENQVAFNVLRAEYRRLINFVTALSKKFNNFGVHSAKFQHVFEKIAEIKFVESEHYTNIDEIAVKMIESLRRVSVVLKEFSWSLPEVREFQGSSEVEVVVKSIVDDFLTTVQRMHLEIETTVLLRQRMFHWTKWGLLSGRFAKNYGTYYHADNKYTSKYDEKYYGSFAKYFNKYGKQFNNKYSVNFDDEDFETEYKFRGPYNSKYYGNTFEGQNWEHTPYPYSYANSKYSTEWKYGQNLESFPETYKHGQNWESFPETWETFPETFKYGNKRFDYGLKHAQNWESYPSEYKYGGNKHTTEWKYGQNWETFPEEYKYGGNKYNTEWKYGQNWESFPEDFTGYNTEWKYGKNWENKHYKSMSQYETPEYYGKDLKTLYQHIRTIAQEVTEQLKTVPLNKDWIKREVTVYVRELVQIVDRIIYRLEKENTTEYKINHIVENFQQIKVELEQLVRSTVSYQSSQVKYQLSTAIEQIVDQFEKLAHFEQYSEVQSFEDIFAQFFAYIRNVRHQLTGTSSVYGRDFEGYNTEYNYQHEQPIFASRLFGAIPKYHQEFTEEY